MKNPFKVGDRVVRVTVAPEMLRQKGMVIGSVWTVTEVTDVAIRLKDYITMEVNYKHFAHEAVHNSPLSKALREDE